MITVDSHTIVRTNTERSCGLFCPRPFPSDSGTILEDCSPILQPGSWHWHRNAPQKGTSVPLGSFYKDPLYSHTQLPSTPVSSLPSGNQYSVVPFYLESCCKHVYRFWRRAKSSLLWYKLRHPFVRSWNPPSGRRSSWTAMEQAKDSEEQ